MKQQATLMERSFPGGLLPEEDEQRYNYFLEQVSCDSSTRQIVISVPLGDCEPLDWLQRRHDPDLFSYYWEKPSQNCVLAAAGTLVRCSGNGPGRFQSLQSATDQLKQHTRHFVPRACPVQSGYHLPGAFSFFDTMEDDTWRGFEAASLILPEYTIVRRGGQGRADIALRVHAEMEAEEMHAQLGNKLTQLLADLKGRAGGLASPAAAAPARGSAEQPAAPENVDRYQQWAETVETARRSIQEHALDKVVLGRKLTLNLESAASGFTALRRLRSRYPHCTCFMYQAEGSGLFIGSSPELLLSVDGPDIRTEALAGSIARGSTEAKDRQLAAALLDSMKNRQEHSFVLSDIKRLLDPYTEELQSSEQPIIKKLANVQHLFSPVKARMKEQTQALPLLGHLHPTPAVGGTPRAEALQFIARHENFDRGLFAGPVGWIDSDNGAEFTVAIRSGLIRDTKAHLFAGCGIVADSDPQTEWQETNLKFTPMLSALNYD